MNLIYVGRNAYINSATMIGSLYHAPLSKICQTRSDWGKVERALEQGEKVTIRKANKSEMLVVEQMIKESNDRWWKTFQSKHI